MIKLQDFAAKYGVTDRQVQRLLKKYEQELSGHFERQGRNGTWIDEDGERILRSKMKTAPVVVQDSEIGQRIARLEQENDELKNKLLLAYEKLTEQQYLLNEANESKYLLQAAEREMEIVKGFAEEKQERIDELQTELNSFVPTLFGLYKKK